LIAMPHLTGKPPESINITGYVFPWYTDTNQPVILRNPSDEHPDAILLPIFSSVVKLHDAIESWLRIDGPWKIKEVQDGLDFTASIMENNGVIIAVDPHIFNGNTRFTAILPEARLG